MKKAAALLALLSLFACGKKGPVLAPLVKVPQKPEKVAAVQRGEQILVDWRIQPRYTDGADLVGSPTVEIWALEQPKAADSKAVPAEIKPAPADQPAPPVGKKSRGRKPAAERPVAPPGTKITAKDFESKGKLVVSLGKDRLPDCLKEKGREAASYSFGYSLAGKKPGGTTFLFALRIKDAKGRTSEFSDPVSIDPRVVSRPPDGFEIRAIEGGVELSWKAPATNTDGSAPAAVAGYNIYRAMKEKSPALVNPAPVRELKYVDREAENGVPLRYSVRTTATETAPYAESGESEVREIVAKDIFPPAPPEAIVPVVGRGFIALSWNANKEKDLAGYKVRRREEGGTEPLVLTPKPIIENAFQDTTVEPGRRYHYLVSSVDAAGNESPPTEIVVDSLKDGLP
jgi:predicted small lipoprotein YifL